MHKRVFITRENRILVWIMVFGALTNFAIAVFFFTPEQPYTGTAFMLIGLYIVHSIILSLYEVENKSHPINYIGYGIGIALALLFLRPLL